MKEVVWVCGPSAVGKETLIRKLVTESEPVLAQRLGWQGKRILVSEISLIDIGRGDDDPILAEREKILDEVPIHLKNADIVLIKWQEVDSGADRPMRLKRLLPNEKHRALFLDADFDELCEREVHKWWWNQEDSPREYRAKELKLVAKYLDDLRNDFNITVIDSSKGRDYKILPTA